MQEQDCNHASASFVPTLPFIRIDYLIHVPLPFFFKFHKVSLPLAVKARFSA
jgi:hypothetical protein